ncbi:MAG: glycyl-tRNA synthetase beta chain [Gammaproteobacteria bacterium]
MNLQCLIEIGTEELPPKALKTLSTNFAGLCIQELEKLGLKCPAFKVFATPRRLAVLLDQVPARQTDRKIEKRGPAVKAAFDAEGCPSRAAQGFAKSCGVTVSDLVQRKTDKGAWLYFEGEEKGSLLKELLPALLLRAVGQLPIPRRMRWGSGSDEFVRPVKWLVVMLDEQVVEAELFGIQSDRLTWGHRFHAPDPISIDHVSNYQNLLEAKGRVIADFEQRKQKIREQIEATAASLEGHAEIDDDLLDEVTALVELPVAVSGEFDREFLAIPPEALITTMQDNQKYFAVFNVDNELIPNFITISNIESRQPEMVAEGNQRVIRPRFADARFFYEKDQKQSLESRVGQLAKVVFQNKLGSIGDKSRRIAQLAGTIADQLGGDVAASKRAGILAKCDLLTDMVGEFPKLQGIMGQYYASHDGETTDIASAISQHYWPRFSGDKLPESIVAQSLALADRLDSLVAIFALGQKPTGVKDPFGLRRAAVGVIRIIIELELSLDLNDLITKAATGLSDKLDTNSATSEVRDYVFDRLKNYYQEKGIALDIVDAVVYNYPGQLSDSDKRIRALAEFQKHESAEVLAAANKRINNILKKQGEIDLPEIQTELFQLDIERELYESLQTSQKTAGQFFADQQYAEGLNTLSLLRPTVDRFFEEVMVMDEDLVLRSNRLALLAELLSCFRQVADFARLQS